MIIGIGGVSRSGKTTLANELKSMLQQHDQSVAVFSLDDFAKPAISLPRIQGIPDWERPGSINWDQLSRAVDRSGADVKIIEGLFAFYPASLRSLYDLKIFLEIDPDTFIKRRSEETRWGEEPAWYLDHVWNSYLKYGTIAHTTNHYFHVDGRKPFDLNAIVSKVPSN